MMYGRHLKVHTPMAQVWSEVDTAQETGFPAVLREIIHYRRMTQIELADAMPVNAATVSRWVHGKQAAGPLQRRRLEELLGIPEGALDGDAAAALKWLKTLPAVPESPPPRPVAPTAPSQPEVVAAPSSAPKTPVAGAVAKVRRVTEGTGARGVEDDPVLAWIMEPDSTDARVERIAGVVARVVARAVHDAILSERELTKTRRGQEAIAEATDAYARRLSQLGIDVSGLMSVAGLLRRGLL